MPPQAVIGLEVHVQLATSTKLFCRCPHRSGAPPNTAVCPTCLGHPGTLPVLNREAVRLAVRLALALGCDVQERSAFARKSYFYPDLPKGYQVTQYDRPLARGGAVALLGGDREVPLQRLHLEEDAGRLVHPGGDEEGGGEGGDGPRDTLVDFNRAGVPLAEIVSEPALRHPEEAEDFLRSLHAVLLHTATSRAQLEEGSLRCDANVSITGADGRPGSRTEIKNLNSFRHVRRALGAEIARQRSVLDAGGRVLAETLGFDEAAGTTHPLRDKESSPDYRYFPEPDLPPLALPAAWVEEVRAGLPEPPGARRDRLARELGLDRSQATLLTADPQRADYLEAAVAARRRAAVEGGEGAAAAAPEADGRVAEWVRTEVLGTLNERGATLAEAPPPEHLGRLVALVERGRLSRRAAKRVLAAMAESGETPEAATERLGLAQVSDPERIAAWAAEAVVAHPELAGRYRAGEEKLLGFFVGRVMERSGGRAEPHAVRRELLAALAGAGGGAGELSTVAEGEGA